MAFYRDLLGKGRFDVLVLPFQVQQFAFDRATRSLMTAQFVELLGRSTGAHIPDPYLVARALGDGERRYAFPEAHRLAEALGVKRIVYGYVGHARNGEMRITLLHQDRGQSDPQWSFFPANGRNYEGLRFTEEIPPIEVFRTLLPDVIKDLGATPKLIGAPISAIGQPARSALTPEPRKTFANTTAPSIAAHQLQLLAALAPYDSDRTRERFAEKSLLAVYAMSPQSAQYRLLKARGLMQIGLRPAAIAALGAPGTAEERHLLAVLNGDLPQAESFAAQIQLDILRFTAWLEVNSIRAAYGTTTQAKSLEVVKALDLPGDVWKFFAARAVTDSDLWSQHDNIALKGLLDHEFPVAGLTAKDIVRGSASIADASKMQALAELSVVDHFQKLVSSSPAKWCCRPLTASVTDFDYLDLISSIGTDNLVRRAKFMTSVQGTPAQALEYLARLEHVFAEHPQFALARATAEAAMIERSDGAARAGLAKSAYSGAFNAYFWEQGQTPTAADAFRLFMRMGRTEYGPYENLYASDVPFRSYFPTLERSPTAIENVHAALRNATWDFQPVLTLASVLQSGQGQPDKVRELMQSLEGRFSGHPGRDMLLAANSVRRGDQADAEQSYRRSIAQQPENWDARWQLGQMLFEKAQPNKAAELFTAYPEFRKGSSENRVAISNYAFQAGSLFYWSGDFANSLPFYRLSAGLRTGSDASITSAARIALLEKDYATAMALSLERARRYNSSYAYRDYFGLLHIFGRSDEAWDGFNVLAAQMQQPHIWETALVGHRIARTGIAEIAAWASQQRYRSAGPDFAYAPMFLVRAAVTDRLPENDLADRVGEIERSVWRIEDNSGHVVRPFADGRGYRLLGPDQPRDTTLPASVFEGARKVQIKSDLVRFAEAMTSIRKSQYSEARSILRDAAGLFDTRNVNLGYLLPYYAYAATKTGNAEEVRSLLATFTPQQQRFDYYLAQAILAGAANRSADALTSLELALHRRPYTENRPVMTEYQFAEACEWIYAATRDTTIKDLLLKWARANQAFQPWFAWAYAVEAKHANSPHDRERSIATANYLDPSSERLSTISKDEINAAVKRLGGRSPFSTTAGRGT